MTNIGLCSHGLGKSGEEKKSRGLPVEFDRALEGEEKKRRTANLSDPIGIFFGPNRSLSDPISSPISH